MDGGTEAKLKAPKSEVFFKVKAFRSVHVHPTHPHTCPCRPSAAQASPPGRNPVPCGAVLTACRGGVSRGYPVWLRSLLELPGPAVLESPSILSPPCLSDVGPSFGVGVTLSFFLSPWHDLARVSVPEKAAPCHERAVDCLPDPCLQLSLLG